MLCEITIENVAVIEKAIATFENGFNVLTGETGAGKSILIDSINAILGNRTSRDIVRSGAAKAVIWARFKDIPEHIAQQIQQAAYPCEDELLLYREITADGKSSCRINGMPATAAILRDLCSGLIDIHGQHDNQSLQSPAQHLAILDTFAQNQDILGSYQQQYKQLTNIQKQIAAVHMNEAEKTRKLDLLRYETEEIDAADLKDGEEEELTEQRDVARHSQTIIDALSQAYLALTGGDEDTGAATLLGEAAGNVTTAARYSSELSTYADTLNEMYYSATELASDIQNKLESYEFNTMALDDLEARLDTIFRLKQKYGQSIAAVLAYCEKAREELHNIEFASERMDELKKQEKDLVVQVGHLANLLTATRQNAFTTLNTQIAEALQFLNMPGIVMTLRQDTVPFGPYGQDDVEFFISTNPGELPKPLGKIASGGELARIMLALKSALANRDAVPTVIYDEIDTGISGLAAGRIGQLLQSTAQGRQVICVTHTAQVAAYAAHHMLIEKQVADGRTYTHIRQLDKPGRVDELARIVSGDSISEAAKENAKEMLRVAGNY